MLILRRKPGESIVIGGDIELVVLDVDGERVKLGIQAPSDVEVIRKELLEEVTEANKLASSVKPTADILKYLQEMGQKRRDK